LILLSTQGILSLLGKPFPKKKYQKVERIRDKFGFSEKYLYVIHPQEQSAGDKLVQIANR
jgi:hypothetical protein